jgi:peptidoglycan/xylan/chitin deacetylase (PgdA/CDA1 family)
MRATFFDVGERAQALPQYVRDQVADGHEVANHSYDHPDLTLLSEAGVRSQLERTQTVLTPLAGYAPDVMRPPYGAINDTVRTVSGQLGLLPVIWTIDTVDWSGVSTAKIVSAALGVQPGGFVLMHDGYANTIAAVPQIAAGLRARGLCAGRIVYSDTPTVAWEGLSFPATVATW